MSISINGNGITSANIADGAITNADVADVAASKLTGALPAISGAALTDLPGGGKILQVILGEDTTETSMATSTFTDVGLSATITPTSTTSTILVMWNMQAKLTEINAGYGTRLLRDSTAVYTGSTAYEIFMGSYSSALRGRADWKHIDSPASTSAITYKIQCRTQNNTLVFFNEANNQTQILLMEIGA